MSQESRNAVVPIPRFAISSNGLKVPNSGTSAFLDFAPKATFKLLL